MTQWWLAFWRRGAKKARARWVSPRLELLEERNLLTQGLVLVPSPAVTGGALFGAAAVAANDIWAGGSFSFIDPTTGAVDVQTLAEHFNGTSWSVISTPAVPSGGVNPPSAHFRGLVVHCSSIVG